MVFSGKDKSDAYSYTNVQSVYFAGGFEKDWNKSKHVTLKRCVQFLPNKTERAAQTALQKYKMIRISPKPQNRITWP